MHNLFGERFLSKRVPPWHRLGQITESDMGAAAAFEKVGSYTVGLRNLRLTDGTAIDQKAIVRGKTKDDPHRRVFNVVSSKYHLLAPQDFCDIWDNKVGRPVETLGVLGQGENIFITTKMPGMDIHGDEIENYLVAVSPMNGTQSAKVMVAPIRVVCQNTLSAAEGSCTEVYRIIHDRHIKANIAAWMTDVYGRSEQKLETLKEAFDALANFNVTKRQVTQVLQACYPMPDAPQRSVSTEMTEKRQRYHTFEMERVNKRRNAVHELLEGDGTALDNKACKGTGWGLYNGIVEVEDYRNSRGEDGAADRSVLFGTRAKVKATAYNSLLKLAS